MILCVDNCYASCADCIYWTGVGVGGRLADDGVCGLTNLATADTHRCDSFHCWGSASGLEAIAEKARQRVEERMKPDDQS